MTHYFSLVLTERPPFFFSLSPKDPTLGVVSAHPRHLYVSVPPPRYYPPKGPNHVIFSAKFPHLCLSDEQREV